MSQWEDKLTEDEINQIKENKKILVELLDKRTLISSYDSDFLRKLVNK